MKETDLFSEYINQPMSHTTQSTSPPKKYPQIPRISHSSGVCWPRCKLGEGLSYMQVVTYWCVCIWCFTEMMDGTKMQNPHCLKTISRSNETKSNQIRSKQVKSNQIIEAINQSVSHTSRINHKTWCAYKHVVLYLPSDEPNRWPWCDQLNLSDLIRDRRN